MTTSIIDIPGIGPETEKTMIDNGFNTLNDVAYSTVEMLANVPGFGEIKAGKVIQAANELLSASLSNVDRTTSAKTVHEQPLTENGAQDKHTKQQKDSLKDVKLPEEEPGKEKLKKAKKKKEVEKAKKKVQKAKREMKKAKREMKKAKRKMQKAKK